MGRRAWAVSLVAVVSIVLGSMFAMPLVPASRAASGPSAPVNVGFTFSERQAGYLDVSWQKAFEAAMDLSPDLVRLGAYWDRIEPTPGKYDFSDLDWLLDHVPAQSSVLLTVGMKAPRWPEYFLPGWLRKSVNVPAGGNISQDATVRSATLRFISQVVQHERARTNIKYWQVENEPLDPSGPRHWRIDSGFLSEEIGLVRSLDSRPIVESMFVDTSPLGALPPWHGQIEDEARELLGLADVLGLDVYPIRPMSAKPIQLALKWPVWLWEPRLRDLRRLAQSAGKQTWISEAQAEPWLPARLVTTGSSPSRNAAPNLTASTVERLQADGFHTILLWGVEYWYMRSARYEDPNWWSGMLPFFRDSRSQSGSPGSA
ncbi:MAG TPA: beta-galactosidase [Chloroflexota bacterium]|nr:beta-galactosidase [Chloroflexota bacterium]